VLFAQIDWPSFRDVLAIDLSFSDSVLFFLFFFPRHTFLEIREIGNGWTRERERDRI